MTSSYQNGIADNSQCKPNLPIIIEEVTGTIHFMLTVNSLSFHHTSYCFCSKPDSVLLGVAHEVPWDAPLQEAFAGATYEPPTLSVIFLFHHSGSLFVASL